MGSSKRAKRRRKRDRPPPFVRGPLGMMRPFVDAAGRHVSVPRGVVSGPLNYLTNPPTPMLIGRSYPATLLRAEWREMEDRVNTVVRPMLNLQVPPLDPRTRKRMEYLRALQAEMAEREVVGLATVDMDDVNYPPLPIVHQEFRITHPDRIGRDGPDLRAIRERARRLAATQEAATLRALQHSAPFVYTDLP